MMQERERGKTNNVRERGETVNKVRESGKTNDTRERTDR